MVVFVNSCQPKRQDNNFSQYGNNQLNKLEYNNPDLLVDLDAGFKAVPMPMDFDGDGDRIAVVGKNGCGKSTLLNSLLCSDGRKIRNQNKNKSKFYYKLFERVYIFSPSIKRFALFASLKNGMTRLRTG